MEPVKKVLDFYIFSSLHVTVCYLAFYVLVSLYAGFTPSIVELVAVGTATLVGYNMAKYIHIYSDSFPFHQAIKSLTVICAIIALITVGILGINAMILFAICGLLTMLYALPEILGRSFRQIPILKLVTIGISWSVMAVILPHFIHVTGYLRPEDIFNLRITKGQDFLIWQIIEYTLFVVALCIPFEIRDLKYDAPRLRTLPQLIGVKNSKITGLILLVICAGIEWMRYQGEVMEMVVTLIVLAVTSICIWFTDYFKSDYYVSFFVEAVPIFWLGLYLAVGH